MVLNVLGLDLQHLSLKADMVFFVVIGAIVRLIRHKGIVLTAWLRHVNVCINTEGYWV